MRHFLLFISFIVIPLIGFAQSAESEISNQSVSNQLNLKEGSFSLENVPVEFNLPNGFKYIDANTSKELLSNAGNNDESIRDVIGMIVPDIQSIDQLNKGWVITYRTVGHIQDDEAPYMGFNWILDRLKQDDSFKNSELSWAWKPKYDIQHHRLSLPLLIVNGTDSILNHRQLIFGKDGLIQVEPIVPLSNIAWLIKNDDLINNAIGFKHGARHIDFTSTDYAYNSVSAYIKGIPAESSTTLQDRFEEKDGPSFLTYFIYLIGIAAITLITIMLVLMLAVTITNKKNETGKDILQSGINVLLRIGVFLMVYLLIFTFAIFLIWVGIWFTIDALSDYISLRSILAIIGGWMIIGSFLWAIVKSLFVFSHPDYPNRLEISQSDAPKLFAIIEEISQTLEEKMPKHIYVSPEVNACVFYDKPFMSLFLQSRKNLVLGLGLLFGLNKQELKAIVAHEYGHFGQKSMRIGQIVFTCYNIISNLVNSEGTSLVHPILKKTFVYVQRGYMTLSRSMEYEADLKSALVAGKEHAISALCKIEVISERFNAYNSFVQNIYESKRILPSTYWNGYMQFLSLTDNLDGIIIDETITATEQLSKVPVSRVHLKNPWISHPTLQQRIENIRAVKSNYIEHNNEKILDIVTLRIFNKTSRKLFENAEYTTDTVCSDSEYQALLAKELDENSFPILMRAFFNRDLFSFDINPNEAETFSKSVDEVFSETNSRIVESLTTAISDYQTMVMFKDKQTSEKQIQYNGVVYNRHNVPTESQLNIIKGLEPRVIAIDKDICMLALSKSLDKDLIMRAYDNIFYSQAIIRHIVDNILPVRDSVAKQIGTGGSKDEDSFKRIQQILLNFKASMRKFIDDIELVRLNPIMHVDMAKSFKYIENEYLFGGFSISGEEVQYIFTLPDNIIAQFRSLAYYSKKIITDTIEEKKPLMFWNNSVASFQATQQI